jgi:hypothetical protein
MSTHITPPLSPFLSLPHLPCSSVVHCWVRLQAHCGPVACCGMRLQAPSITVKCPIYVHIILTLVCLCKALRLTRLTCRLRRPSHRLPRLTRSSRRLISPTSPFPSHLGTEVLCCNQLSVGQCSFYPLQLSNLRYTHTHGWCAPKCLAWLVMQDTSTRTSTSCERQLLPKAPLKKPSFLCNFSDFCLNFV